MVKKKRSARVTRLDTLRKRRSRASAKALGVLNTHTRFSFPLEKVVRNVTISEYNRRAFVTLGARYAESRTTISAELHKIFKSHNVPKLPPASFVVLKLTEDESQWLDNMARMLDCPLENVLLSLLQTPAEPKCTLT